MNAIVYHPGCTYLRSDSQDELLVLAERYAKKGFIVFGGKTSTKGVVKKPKYFEVTMVPQ